jgi:hypothetical protein
MRAYPKLLYFLDTNFYKISLLFWTNCWLGARAKLKTPPHIQKNKEKYRGGVFSLINHHQPLVLAVFSFYSPLQIIYCVKHALISIYNGIKSFLQNLNIFLYKNVKNEAKALGITHYPLLVCPRATKKDIWFWLNKTKTNTLTSKQTSSYHAFLHKEKSESFLSVCKKMWFAQIKVPFL